MPPNSKPLALFGPPPPPPHHSPSQARSQLASTSSLNHRKRTSTDPSLGIKREASPTEFGDESSGGEQSMVLASQDVNLASQASANGRLAKRVKKPVLNVEVRLGPARGGHSDDVADALQPLFDYLKRQKFLRLESHLDSSWKEERQLRRSIDQIWIGDCKDASGTKIFPSDVTISLHSYRLASSNIEPIIISTDFDEEEPNSDYEGAPPQGEDTRVRAGTLMRLPCERLENKWDKLIYDGGLKDGLLAHMNAAIALSEWNADPDLANCNRLILLHGPPGTGKTSLCKALAQKVTIRLDFATSYLVEINSHSLFSKWFSDSGKLVQKMFDYINARLDEEDSFVFVMIDEAESLVSARSGSMSANEPTDAVRVVNAMLTQLDKLAERPNCFVMTTSNLTGALDNAFLDRADRVEYIGLPPPGAIYSILQSTLEGVVLAKGKAAPEDLLSWSEVDELCTRAEEGEGEVMGQATSVELRKLALRCHELELSGRFLRKLLPAALAAEPGLIEAGLDTSLMEFVEAFELAVEDKAEQRRNMGVHV